MTRDPSLSSPAIVTNRFAEENDAAFAATIDGLRIELAPTTIFESLWVEMALMAMKRLRISAQLEDDDSPTNPQWMRFQTSAERSLNNAFKNLEKCRRLAARALEAAPPVPKNLPAPPPTPHFILESVISKPSKEEITKPEEPETVAPTPQPRVADTPEAFAKLKKVIDSTETLDELLGGIEPALRIEFLEPFREEVVDMLADGFTPDEIIRGLPGLTLDDVQAFRTGAALSAPPPAEPDQTNRVA